MEYSTHYDYYLYLDGVKDKNGDTVHYELVEISDNFGKINNIRDVDILGKNILELIDKYESVFVGLKDIYQHIGPNTIRKFEIYAESVGRWYLVNIFTKNSGILVLYTDITVTKEYLVNVGKMVEDASSTNCYKDGLTGLYNKDYFKVELSRLDTERQLPISIIIGDLNGLKLINDAFGYYLGDEAIKTTADILKMTFRKEDIICRFGGDEFVILLPKTSKEEAEERIQKVKKLFSVTPIDFLELTMSFGLYTKERTGQNVMDIYKRAEEEMYFNKLKESNKAKFATINSLKKRLMETATETEEHHARLKKLASALGKKIGISKDQEEDLNLLCEYHDIGTISIPNHIYHKSEELSQDDWHTIKRHCESGYHIMKSVTFDRPIAEHILMHHERWDGKGYPRGLKSNEIPLVVRIFHIIDAYEAMVNHRPNRPKLTHEEAMKEIKANAGRQFDSDLVEKFVFMMDNGFRKNNLKF